MVDRQLVRRYAHNQQIDLEVADQEIVLHYTLALLNDVGIVGPKEDGTPGPLLFKGGTALRKCVFGSTGRFSQDIDLDAPHKNGFEAEIEKAFSDNDPYHGISFSFVKERYSADNNFSGTVRYEHEDSTNTFELQISYRLDPILNARDLVIENQEYLRRVECGVPTLHGLDPYEMIGEKLMACNRRRGGSGKDVYDLFLWSARPFDEALVRRLSVLKAWTDQRSSPRYEPQELLDAITPRSFRWTDIERLVPRRLASDPKEICGRVASRFKFLADCTEEERQLLDDQTAHRERGLFDELKEGAQQLAEDVSR